MSSSPRMTKAAAFLNSISNEEHDNNIPVLKPRKSLVENNSNKPETIFSPTASPIKKSERPLTSVQQMIKAKEQETKENRALNFTPRPDNKTIKERKSIFITQQQQNFKNNINNFNNINNNNNDDKLSKSEINKMGVINNAMSNSPSMKNLNKLKNIQSRLTSISNINNEDNTNNQNDLNIKKSKSNLPKTFSTKNINKQLTTPSSIAIKNWLDTDRDNLKLAAFVCRMVEIRHWIENLLNIDIALNDSDIDQFPDYLTNGILLAEIARYFDPENVSKVYTGFKSINNNNNDNKINYKMINKQFKFTENIVKFLDFLRRVKLPSLFIFETNDLYEKKDIPKVIACLHALSCLMSMLGKCDPVNKLTEDEDVSSAIVNLNVNVSKLKQIKHKVGRFGGVLGRKYIEGFDEAVRVNVGDHIRKLQLVELDSDPKPSTKVNIDKIENIEDHGNVKELNEDSILLSKIEDSNDVDKSLLSLKSDLDIEKTNLDTNLDTDLDIDLDLDLNSRLSDIEETNLSAIDEIENDSTHTITEPSSPESPLISPPTAEEQEYTHDARLLFNKTTFIPSMPSVHSISEIQKKYQFLINEEERELLGGNSLQSSFDDYTNAYQDDSILATTKPITTDENDKKYSIDTINTISDSPEDNIIRLQSLARGYLLRFDLFVTKAILKGNTSSVISFQSICRGVISRRKFNLRKESDIIKHNTDVQIDSELDDISLVNEFGSSDLMKTILKNKKKHAELISNLSNLKKEETNIINLQASIRGMFVRQNYWHVRKFLLREMNLIIKLQSIIRSNIIRKKIKNKTYFLPTESKLTVVRNSCISPSHSKIVTSIESPKKKERVKSRRIYHSYDDQNPLKAPYDENELFEQFDIPTTPSPRKKSGMETMKSSKQSIGSVDPTKLLKHSSKGDELIKPAMKLTKEDEREKPCIEIIDDADLPQPGKVPRRKEARRENAKYIPNLPIEEPTTPPRKSRSPSKLQHSPTKVSLSGFILPNESRLSSSNTVLFNESRVNEKDEIVTTEQIEKLEETADNVIELQSFARGALTRNHLNSFIDQIYDNEEVFSDFTSIARGVLARQAYKQIRKDLYQCQNEIISIQSILRGIETRVDYDCLIEDIYEYTEPVTYLQNDIRGFLVRKRIRDRDAWFRKPDNLAKICRLQAIIRGLHGIQDYRALIEAKNPPVRAVKKFIGLLGGLEAEKTSKDELEIMKLREEIKSEKNNVKEELEKLSNLKIKVEILRKNGIDIKTVEGGLRKNVDAGNAVLTKLVDVEDIIGLDKTKVTNNSDTSSGIIIKKENAVLNECIGNFFYILQTKPEYWARVLNYIEMTGDLVEFSHGHIEDWVLKCFNYDDTNSTTIATQTREECLYIKLILCTFKLYLARISDNEFKETVKFRWDLDFVDIKYWEILLHAYLNLSQQRTVTKTLLDDAVFLITSDDDVRFECDPIKIFQHIVDTTDNISEAEQINVEVGNVDPLEISCVESEYIKNMQDLRGSVYEIFKYLKKIISKFPTFIRCLCREMYEAMKSTMTVSDDYYLSMMGSVFLRCFVLPIFQTPANYSIDIFAISDDLGVIENVTRNLELVSILLNQCVFMKHFDVNKHPYLTSLNPFIDDLSGQMKDFLCELIDIPLIDISYRKVMLETSQESMFLKIQYDDIGELTFIWKEFIKEIFGEHNDVLYYSIKEIEDILGTGNKKGKRKLPCDSYGFTIIKLVDNKEEEVDKIVGEAIMLEVKKYLIYILQVQDGEDLVDVLVSEIEPADELKFKEIVKEERKLIRNNKTNISVSERKAIDEIHNSSFPQVKKRALELIFELERLGMISQSDGYQNLLNDIANDIRNKRKQYEERDLEKVVIVETLTELKRRSRTYQKKYEEYEETIKGILNQRLMRSIQREEDKDNSHANESGNHSKAFLSKLFSKSGRKIRKSAQVIHRNKVTGGALYGQYKMSLKQLMDKGIIQSVGESIDSMNSSGFGGLKGSSKLGRINAIFKCNKPGYFQISLSGGGHDNDDGNFNVSLDELLVWQYESKMDIKAFDGEIVFYCGGLLKYIINTFYSG